MENHTLKMVRRGTFRFKQIGDHHCGLKSGDGFITVDYDVAVICEPLLDRRGFLFDQVSIDNFFKSIKSSSLSCEQLTIRCAQKLVKMMLKENPSCRIKSISVKLSAWPHFADMTYSLDLS